jgi:uncharacterized membrane protein YbhN (UPF0104 family)
MNFHGMRVARMGRKFGREVSWRRIAQILLISAAGIYLVQRVLLDVAQLRNFDWELKVGTLLVSYILLLAAFAGYPLVWWLLLKEGMGADLRLSKAFRIWYVSNLGRYIPGKIWQIVGRVELARAEGVSPPACAASVVYETGLIVISGALVFLLALAALGGDGPGISTRPVLILLPLGLILLHPSVFSAGTNKILRILRRPEVTLDVGTGWAASVFALYGLLWIVQGSGFFFLVRSLADVPGGWLPKMVGIFSASWIAGFLSLVTPGGLGVREGVMALLLGMYLPPSVSAVISILSRIWITLGEVFCVIAFWRA